MHVTTYQTPHPYSKMHRGGAQGATRECMFWHYACSKHVCHKWLGPRVAYLLDPRGRGLHIYWTRGAIQLTTACVCIVCVAAANTHTPFRSVVTHLPVSNRCQISKAEIALTYRCFSICVRLLRWDLHNSTNSISPFKICWSSSLIEGRTLALAWRLGKQPTQFWGSCRCGWGLTIGRGRSFTVR